MRRAEAGDLERVAALWSAVLDHHAGIDPSFALRGDAGAALRAALGRELRDARAAVLVWERAGDLEGFCCARVDTAPPPLAERARAEITELAVREPARRRGIGRGLAEAALAWIAERGVARVEVRVAHANREGRAFWRALGFAAHVDVLQRRL